MKKLHIDEHRALILVPGYFGETLWNKNSMGKEIHIEQVWGMDQSDIWFGALGRESTEEELPRIREWLENRYKVDCSAIDAVASDIAEVAVWCENSREKLIKGLIIMGDGLKRGPQGGDDDHYDYYPGAVEAFRYMCKELDQGDLYEEARKEGTKNSEYGEDEKDQYFPPWIDK